jgi:hypothetical protein
MMRNFLLCLIMAGLVAGCSSYSVREQFDKTLDSYNEALRWFDWSKASYYTEDSIRKEFKARAAAAKDVRIADYRIVNKTYNPEKRQATVEVDIDYYRLYSPSLKTLHDTQKWVYFEKNGTGAWRLETLLPVFR